MLIDVNKWIDKNGSFDEAGGLDLVRHGYEWIRRMRKFENKADRHTFQKVFGDKRGDELWDCFLEVGKSIFIYVCQPISLYGTTRDIQERPALYTFKIATAYFREQDLVPVFENSHCKLMKL